MPLFSLTRQTMVVCLSDGADVLYNKFNANSLFPPNKPLQHPNTIYGCVAATTDHWKVSRCEDQHLVVCQSDNNTLTGIGNLHFSLPHTYINDKCWYTSYNHPVVVFCRLYSQLLWL